MNPDKRLVLTLALGLSSLHSLWASDTQGPADTLRRSLTVMTDDPVVLNQRKALPLSLNIVAPQLATPNSSYIDRPLALPRELDINPLRSLPSTNGLFASGQQRGYASAWLGGLDRRADIRAGVKLLNTERNYLDLHTAFSTYRYDFSPSRHAEYLKGMSGRRKGNDFNLNAYYRHLFDSGLQLSASLGYRFHQHNNWGLGIANNITTYIQSVDSQTWSYGNSDNGLYSNISSASVGLTNTKQVESLWYYDLNLKLVQATIGKSYSSSTSSTYVEETHPWLTYLVERSIGSSQRIGMVGDLHLVNYGQGGSAGNGIIDVHTPDRGTADFIFNINPYFKTENGDTDYRWTLLAGLGLSTSDNGVKKHLFLFPKLDFNLTFGTDWAFRAYAQGGTKPNTLLSQFDGMPLLGFGYTLDPERTGLDIGISAKGLINEVFSLHLATSYQSTANALSFEPIATVGTLPNAPFQYAPIEYTPYYTRLKTWNLEAEAGYLISSQLEVEGGFRYHNYQSAMPVSGRPELELEARLRYRPISALQLSVGLQQSKGFKQYGIERSHLTLDAVNQFHLSALYKLNRSWSFGAQTRLFFSSSTSYYWGMPMERLLVQLGANFNF